MKSRRGNRTVASLSDRQYRRHRHPCLTDDNRMEQLLFAISISYLVRTSASTQQHPHSSGKAYTRAHMWEIAHVDTKNVWSGVFHAHEMDLISDGDSSFVLFPLFLSVSLALSPFACISSFHRLIGVNCQATPFPDGPDVHSIHFRHTRASALHSLPPTRPQNPTSTMRCLWFRSVRVARNNQTTHQKGGIR